MAQRETWLQSDLKKPAQVQALRGVMFSQDNQGDLVGVNVYDNGQPAQLSGTVLGYIVKDNGDTVTVTGTLQENRAWIVLPANAYDVVGMIHIAIQLKANSTQTSPILTLGMCAVYVQRTQTGDIVTPEYRILDVAAILEMIDDVNAATAAANAAAANANTKAALADTAAANANAAAGSLENMDATATTIAPGSSATAQVSTVDDHYRLALGIPQGIQGETGPGASITAQATAYQVSASGTTVPTGEWLDTQPATPPGQFLWMRRTITWNDGQTTVLYGTSYQGINGQGAVSTVNGISPDSNGNVALPIDSAPASGSTNPVESGGVYTAVEAAKNTIGIVANGNTAPQDITKGQYVIWNGALYTASANIPSGDALSASNLDAVSGGGLNDILGNYIKKRTVTVTTGGSGNVSLTYPPLVAYATGSLIIPFKGNNGQNTYIKVFDTNMQPRANAEVEITYYHLNVDV